MLLLQEPPRPERNIGSTTGNLSKRGTHTYGQVLTHFASPMSCSDMHKSAPGLQSLCVCITRSACQAARRAALSIAWMDCSSVANASCRCKPPCCVHCGFRVPMLRCGLVDASQTGGSPPPLSQKLASFAISGDPKEQSRDSMATGDNYGKLAEGSAVSTQSAFGSASGNAVATTTKPTLSQRLAEFASGGRVVERSPNTPPSTSTDQLGAADSGIGGGGAAVGRSEASVQPTGYEPTPADVATSEPPAGGSSFVGTYGEGSGVNSSNTVAPPGGGGGIGEGRDSASSFGGGGGAVSGEQCDFTAGSDHGFGSSFGKQSVNSGVGSSFGQGDTRDRRDAADNASRDAAPPAGETAFAGSGTGGYGEGVDASRSAGRSSTGGGGSGIRTGGQAGGLGTSSAAGGYSGGDSFGGGAGGMDSGSTGGEYARGAAPSGNTYDSVNSDRTGHLRTHMPEGGYNGGGTSGEYAGGAVPSISTHEPVGSGRTGHLRTADAPATAAGGAGGNFARNNATLAGTTVGGSYAPPSPPRPAVVEQHAIPGGAVTNIAAGNAVRNFLGILRRIP